MPTTLITGGSGFIGRALCRHLADCGHQLIVLTRQTFDDTAHCRYIQSLDQIDTRQKVDTAINLAGEPLNSARWDNTQKSRIVQSRIGATRKIQQWLRKQDRILPLLISGSAIGWYGHQGAKFLDETSPARCGFSHDLCDQWEKTALQCRPHARRIALLRTGIVLEKDGGPLKEMLPAYKLGLGGRLGSGEQIWSWIHRTDLIRLIGHIIADERLEGPVNATAPEPSTQADFARALGLALHRPAIVPIPAFAARLLMGEFADEVLLNGQYVYPQKALDNGFNFDYPAISEALESIFSKYVKAEQADSS